MRKVLKLHTNIVHVTVQNDGLTRTRTFTWTPVSEGPFRSWIKNTTLPVTLQQSINKQINQSINQSMNQSINQQTNKPIQFYPMIVEQFKIDSFVWALRLLCTVTVCLIWSSPNFLLTYLLTYNQSISGIDSSTFSPLQPCINIIINIIKKRTIF